MSRCRCSSRQCVTYYPDLRRPVGQTHHSLPRVPAPAPMFHGKARRLGLVSSVPTRPYHRPSLSKRMGRRELARQCGSPSGPLRVRQGSACQASRVITAQRPDSLFRVDASLDIMRPPVCVSAMTVCPSEEKNNHTPESFRSGRPNGIYEDGVRASQTCPASLWEELDMGRFEAWSI